MLANASHYHQPTARDNHTAPFGAVFCAPSRCVCVINVFVVVVVVVVVLVKVFVVIVVVAAAVVVDVLLLFGCESRSGSDRPCE